MALHDGRRKEKEKSLNYLQSINWNCLGRAKKMRWDSMDALGILGEIQFDLAVETFRK